MAMFDKNDGTAADESLQNEPNTQVTDTVEDTDLDGAALLYVLGHDADPTSRPLAETEYEDLSEDDFVDWSPQEQAPAPEHRVTHGTRRHRSWRRVLDASTAKSFHARRSAERMMQQMGDLWQRLFPIDYDSIPLADYTRLELGAEDGLGRLTDDIPSAEEQPVTTEAGAIQRAAGAVVSLAGRVRDGVSRSDTSNKDTVLIGHASLKALLHKDDGVENNGQEAVPASNPEEEEAALPETLTSLYDEAKGMFDAIDDVEERTAPAESVAEGITEPARDSDLQTEAEGSPFSDEAEDNESDESLRREAEREWAEIQQEIILTEQQVEEGLEALDILSTVPETTTQTSEEDAEGEPQATATDDSEPKPSEEGAEPSDDADAEKASLLDETQPMEPEESETENLPSASEQTSETETTESEATAPTGDSDADRAKPGLMQRIHGFFRKAPTTAESDGTGKGDQPADADDSISTVAKQEPESPDTTAETVAMPVEDLPSDESTPVDQQEAVGGGDTEIITGVSETSGDYRKHAESESDVGEPAEKDAGKGTRQPEYPKEQEESARSRTYSIGKVSNYEINIVPDLLKPLPMSQQGHVRTKVRVKPMHHAILNGMPSRETHHGQRSSRIRLSVKPSKVDLKKLDHLPEGSGYLPERSPIGTRPKEVPNPKYKPIRRIKIN